MNYSSERLHLNWDARNKNGIIINAQYPNGALFHGDEHKPVLSVDYVAFEYDERGDTNYIEIRTEVAGSAYHESLPLSPQLAAEIKALAESWAQPLGQEGNPSPEQIVEHVQGYIQQILQYTDQFMVSDFPIENRDEFIEYRQMLRDLNHHPDFPEVEIPNPPAPVKKARNV